MDIERIAGTVNSLDTQTERIDLYRLTRPIYDEMVADPRDRKAAPQLLGVLAKLLDQIDAHGDQLHGGELAEVLALNRLPG